MNINKILIGVVAAIVLAGGGFLIFSSTSNTNNELVQESGQIDATSITSESAVSASVASISEAVSSDSNEDDSDKITSEKLANNNTDESCFVAYEKKVYDVTEFLNGHPGGKASLEEFCGKELDDVSETHPGGSFDSMNVQIILEQFYIGELA